MRRFDVGAPNQLWVSDVTEHPMEGGKVYVAVVLDAWSRMVIGWSIADHIRSELVVDALQMAIWRRRPPVGKTICHTDHGSQYTSWAFGRRLRAAGLLGSMGSIGDCFDNSLAESFFATLQLALLDRQLQPGGVRVTSHGRRRCSMINPVDLSGRSGQAHAGVRARPRFLNARFFRPQALKSWIASLARTRPRGTY